MGHEGKEGAGKAKPPPGKAQGFRHVTGNPQNTEARAGPGLMLLQPHGTQRCCLKNPRATPVRDHLLFLKHRAPLTPLLLHIPPPTHMLLSPMAKSHPKSPHLHPKTSPRHLAQASFYGQSDPRDGKQLRSRARRDGRVVLGQHWPPPAWIRPRLLMECERWKRTTEYLPSASPTGPSPLFPPHGLLKKYIFNYYEEIWG